MERDFYLQSSTGGRAASFAFAQNVGMRLAEHFPVPGLLTSPSSLVRVNNAGARSRVTKKVLRLLRDAIV